MNKDESITIVDGLYAGGRTMYGLAAALTGENVSMIYRFNYDLNLTCMKIFLYA